MEQIGAWIQVGRHHRLAVPGLDAEGAKPARWVGGFCVSVFGGATLEGMQTDELLTYEELGELLKLKKTAMAAAKRRGDLPPAIRIGRKNLRWRRQTVEAWLEQREEPVAIDPVFAERSAKAVAARKAKAKSQQQKPEPEIGQQAVRRRGRPTKAEEVARRRSSAV